MNLRKHIATSVCMTCLTTSIAYSQQNAPATNQNQQPQVQVQAGPVQVQSGSGKEVHVRTGHPSKHAHMMTNDQILASCIAISNQTEVAIAKEAEGKVQRKEVKEFAAMLVKDHQQFLQRLQKFAPDAARDGYLNETAEAIDRDRQVNANKQPAPRTNVQVQDTNVQVQPAETREAAAETNHHLDLVQLHREVAQECIQSAKTAMSKKNESEIDQCFIGFQIAAHASMKDKLVVFQRHASGELRETISEGLQATERHMKKAEEIMKTLNKSNDQKVTLNEKQ